MKALDSAGIVVVGGGAAGLMAAKRAADLSAHVTIFEKSERVGTKILISGGGKCNLTHDGSMEDVRSAFRANEARFLKPCFYSFTNNDFLTILHDEGIPTYVRPDGRIFPVEPTNAKDIVAALEKVVQRAGVKVECSAAVSGLAVDDGKIIGIRLGTRFVGATRVIVAVGGSSYPATGTTGDGWRWAAEAGHTIAPLRAALAPLYLSDPQPDWSGVALRDVVLRARVSDEGKEYVRWRGDLLFTHKGISGPCALGISRNVAEQMASGSCSTVIEVDLAPDVGFEELRESIRADFTYASNKLASTVAAEYLPHRLREPFFATTGINSQARGAQLSLKSINSLCSGLKAWSLGGVRAIPLERGEVVAGGVSLDEVNPQTMESRLVKGLYLCGEVMDIAGPVGGYNLQAAWSAGYVAGTAAAKAGAI